MNGPNSPLQGRLSAHEIRTRLLEEVLVFVQAACRLTGVTRIALVGSLTIAKPNPKDADLLITIAAGAPLKQLARYGRRLQGRAQSHNRGADIFLADPEHRYLGRTCPWKRCLPGIRVRCEALNCGRRQYLYDDLQNIRLAQALIAEPPVELWPALMTRVEAPEDLNAIVLQPMHAFIDSGASRA